MSVNESKNQVSSDTKIGFLEYVLSHIQDQIRFADSKASFFFSFGVILFGIVLSTLVRFSDVHEHLVEHGYEWAFFVLIALFISYLSFAVAGLVKVVMVFYPRTSREGMESIYYFNDIAAISSGEYENKMRALTREDILVSLSSQIVANSEIASSKYRHLKTSIGLMVTSLVLGILYASIFMALIGVL
jgi:hypothetical protein